MTPTTQNTGDRRELRKVILVLTVGVCAISLAATFFLKAQPTHPLASAGIRLSLAFALLLPFLVRAWRRGHLTRRLLKHGLMAGLCYGIHFGAWVWSLGETSVTASVTLVTATPLVLAVWSLISGRDRPTRRHWLAIGLAIVGVGIIGYNDAGDTGGGSLVGDALAFLGALGMAGYLLTARHFGKDLDVWAFGCLATGAGALSLLITAVALGIPFEAASSEAFLFLFLAALIPQLVGHTALTWVLRHRSPTLVSIATVSEPVGATLIAWAWLGATVELGVALGCSVTLAAVIIALSGSKKASQAAMDFSA